MPSWLVLLLGIAGCILITGLLAAGCTGRWSTLPLAAKQFSLVLLALAVPALVVLVGLFIFSA
jgi:hypothetical protein